MKLPQRFHNAIWEGKCHWRVSSTWNMLESLESSDIFRYLQMFSRSKPTQPNPRKLLCWYRQGQVVSSKKHDKSAEFSPWNHSKNWPLLGVLAERDSSCVTSLNHHGFSTETNHQGFLPQKNASCLNIMGKNCKFFSIMVLLIGAYCSYTCKLQEFSNFEGSQRFAGMSTSQTKEK
jgi:hypothetical protein